jgi:hypothetical protein
MKYFCYFYLFDLFEFQLSSQLNAKKKRTNELSLFIDLATKVFYLKYVQQLRINC